MSLYVDIYKKLDNFELNVHFEAENGTLALFGASGCGKSMTLKCIAGIEKPDKGRIVLDGKVLFDSEKHINLTPQKRKAGYLFQQYALFPNMTVEENIACGIQGKKNPEKVLKMIKSMHLDGIEKKYPGQISGGQQQRTALARILIGEPDVLMLDEPFSALDTHLRYQMEEEVRHTIEAFGKPVLLVSHNSDEVYRLSDMVAIMKDGKIENLETKRLIFKNPGTVNGAVLTGYRNISKAHAVGRDKIYAEDWGAELDVNGNAEDAEYIGVRTEAVKLGDNHNTVRCVVKELIANPFTFTVMVSPAQGNAKSVFAITVSKTNCNLNIGDEVIVSVPKESIVILKK